ncbi:helix-turn-helix domain-containing protein [Dyella choica]|uniref:helix-turn-helix domain-containing protein n=1 Tax=Dyella choica TaxID=1927959 RepID=UPI0018AD5E62|nr:helix-turn-helix transcriptional regulator [Dyella choica]
MVCGACETEVTSTSPHTSGHPFAVTTTGRDTFEGARTQGRVVLEAELLKHLRYSRQLSQDELANECSLRHIRVSISSIKRAETSKPVLFRIARELARFFDVPAEQLICSNAPEASNGKALEHGAPQFVVREELAKVNAIDAPHAYPNTLEARDELRSYVEALSLANKALRPDCPATVRNELARLKGVLLKLLDLPENSMLYLLAMAELAQNDGEHCEAWCELADAYRHLGLESFQ